MDSFIFDIGGVLINFNIQLLLKKFAAAHHCEAADIQDVFQSDWVYRVETGKISSLDFFNDHVKTYLGRMSYDEWIAAWMENYALNQPGMGLLEQVKKKGYATYLLSNLAEHHKIAIERKFPDFFGLCDRNFLSYEMGLFKPELEIYREVCREIHQEPGDCIFFDDTAVNVAGALEAGMRAFQFSNDRLAGIVNQIRELKAV